MSQIASVAMPQRQSLPINERLERAAQLVLRSRIFYDIWIYFEGDTRADILDTMQEFSEFFRFDPHAHFVAFIVQMAALFEKRKDTINLPLLAKEVMPTSKMGGASPSQYPAEINALLDQAKPLASKVIIFRNNLFAHRSATLSYAEAFKKAAVTSNQLRDLTEIALQIANRLLILRGLNDQSFNQLPALHADAMLKALGRQLVCRRAGGIRFLSMGPRLCSTLPPDAASR
jgi:hypothetical protein